MSHVFSDGKLRTAPCLMDGDLHDAGRYQRRLQRQQGGDRRRDVINHLDGRDDRATNGVERNPVEKGHGYFLKGFVAVT